MQIVFSINKWHLIGIDVFQSTFYKIISLLSYVSVRLALEPRKEVSNFINRCQKAVDENKKVLIGFVLSNPSMGIFLLKNGEHSNESHISLKARLIKVDWVKIGQDMVYKTERAELQQAPNVASQQQSYAENSF